jgi:hypothetical protein
LTARAARTNLLLLAAPGALALPSCNLLCGFEN